MQFKPVQPGVQPPRPAAQVPVRAALDAIDDGIRPGVGQRHRRRVRHVIEVRVADDGETFRVEIVNDAPEMVAAMREPSDGSGRGLHIVNALARTWGTYATGGEKVVWFEL